MPFKNLQKLKECQHQWYLNNRALTYARSKAWKERQRMLANETPIDKARRKAREYYQRNRERIKALYHKKKQMLIEIAALSVDPDYVSPRMQKLIDEFGETDARWYENIRLGVLKGISIKTRPEQEQERWFDMLKRRAKEIGDKIYSPHRRRWKEDPDQSYDDVPQQPTEAEAIQYPTDGDIESIDETVPDTEHPISVEDGQ